MRAMAMLTLLCQPPESLPAFLSSTGPSSSRAASSFIFAPVFSFEKPQMPQIRARFSSTLRLGATAVSCGETAISRFTRSGSLVMLYPPTTASPAVGLVRQESIFITVVFPAPFTPSREKSSPFSILSSSPLTARTSP